MAKSNNNNNNTGNARNISKDDIFGYINQLTERIDYLESELQKAEAYKNTEEMLLKMIKTTEKSLNDVAEQLAAAQRRNDAALRFLEDHMSGKTDVVMETPVAAPSKKEESFAKKTKEAAKEVKEETSDPTDIRIEDNGVEIVGGTAETDDDFSDIFNLFNN